MPNSPPHLGHSCGGCGGAFAPAPHFKLRSLKGEQKRRVEAGEKKWCPTCFCFTVDSRVVQTRSEVPEARRVLTVADVLGRGVLSREELKDCRWGRVRHEASFALDAYIRRMARMMAAEDFVACRNCTEVRCRRCDGGFDQTASTYATEIAASFGVESASMRRRLNVEARNDLRNEANLGLRADNHWSQSEPVMEIHSEFHMEQLPDCGVCLEVPAEVRSASGRVVACKVCAKEWVRVAGEVSWQRLVRRMAPVVAPKPEIKTPVLPWQEIERQLALQARLEAKKKSEARKAHNRRQQEAIERLEQERKDFLESMNALKSTTQHVRRLAPGRCYARLFHLSVQDEVQDLLQDYPTVEAIRKLIVDHGLEKYPLSPYRMRITDSVEEGCVHIKSGSGKFTAEHIIWSPRQNGKKIGGRARYERSHKYRVPRVYTSQQIVAAELYAEQPIRSFVPKQQSRGYQITQRLWQQVSRLVIKPKVVEQEVWEHDGLLWPERWEMLFRKALGYDWQPVEDYEAYDEEMQEQLDWFSTVLEEANDFGYDPADNPWSMDAGVPDTLEDRDLVIGGEGDCWRKVFPTWEHETHMTMAEFKQRCGVAAEAMKRMSFKTMMKIVADGEDFHLEEVALDMILKMRKVDMTGWYSFADVADFPETTSLIGSGMPSADKIIAEAMQVQGVQLGTLRAQEAFDSDYKSMPKTKFRMTGPESARMARYLGFPVLSQNKEFNGNDHLWIEVARDLIRERLDSLFPHNQDYNTVLHVGATSQEIRRWWSHLGHDFHIAAREDKDAVRCLEDFTKLLGGKLTGMKLPSLTSYKGNATRLKIDSVDEAIRLYEKGGRHRIFNHGMPERQYNTLFFEDCLYDMTEAQFADYWKKTGATIGYAVMFFPDHMKGEDAVDSELYRYQEYYEIDRKVEDLIADIWPSILLLEPLLPLHGIAEFFHKFIRWAFTKGWAIFKDWLSHVVHDDFPLEVAFGTIYNIGKIVPIFQHLLKKLVPVFRFHFARASVVWKGGFSNGYDHAIKTWEPWLKKRRFDIGGGKFVDSEIKVQHGEMHLVKFWISSGTTPITYTVELPPERTAVHVLDLEAGREKILGQTGFSYIKCNMSDWFKLINWALAEPIETLSFNVMMTTLNRIRGGLSLSSNVLVEPMSMMDPYVSKIALAAYIEVARRQNIIAEIENDESLKKNWTANYEYVIKQFLAFGLTAITGGMIFPLVAIMKWLFTTYPSVEIVKYPVEPKTIYVRGRTKIPGVRRMEPADFFKRELSIVMPHKEEKAKLACRICDLWKQGKFSKTGIPAEGQRFICTHAEAKNEHDLSFSGPEMVDMALKVRDAETAHTAMGATKLVPVLTKFKHWLEANQGGIEWKSEVHHIRGGPGTGKTEVIKSLMAYFEKQGLQCGVITPFTDLQADYKNVQVFGENGMFTFDAQTTWYSAKWAKQDVIFVDECTAVDWKLIKAVAIHSGCRKIFLVGDKAQTTLNSAAGEGVDPTNEQSGLDWTEVPTHELVKNYRMDAWRVKLHNKVWGYNMLPTRTDMLPPKFISRAVYDEMKANGDGAEREFVFAHAAGLQIFGKESVAGDREKDNLSVRSAQGKTVKGPVAVSASELDSGVITVHGMLNVANSRSKGQTYYVFFEAETDPVVVSLKRMLHCDTQERIEAISNSPLPKIEDAMNTEFELSEEETKMEAIMRAKAECNKVEILTDPDDDDKIQTLMVQEKKTMDLHVIDGFSSVADFKMLEFYKTQFHWCLFDAIFPETMSQPESEALLKWIGKVYCDDNLMGRAKTNLLKFQRFFSLRNKALPVVDGKRLIDIKEFASWVHKELGDLTIYDKGLERFIFVSPSYRSNPGARRVFHIAISKAHAERDDACKMKCYVEGILDQQEMPHYEVFQGGILLRELHEKKKKDRFLGDYRHNLPQKRTEGWVQAEIVPNGTNDFPTVTAEIVTQAEVGIEVEVQRTLEVEVVPVLEAEVIPARTLEAEIGDMADILVEDAGEPVQLDLVAGYQLRKPTIERVTLPDLSRKHFNLMNRYQPITSSWKEVEKEPDTDRIHRKTKLRLGTNGYLLRSVISPANAYTRAPMLNEAGVVQGVTNPSNATLNWDGFIHQRTRAGRIRSWVNPEYRSLDVGVGNHYNNSPVESLLAAQRIGKRGKKPSLNSETIAFAREVARATFKDFWYPAYVKNQEVINARVEEAIKTAKQRNYHGRMDAEHKKGFLPKLTVSNKDQFKPIKNGQLKLGKYGQVLVQSPPSVNLQFMAWMRIQGFLFKKNLKPDVFTDDYESASNFRKRITKAIKELPSSVLVGIVDGEEWDSQQNQVTLEIEKELCRLFGACNETIKEYFQVRGNLDYIMHGVFKGTMNGEKGSGFLDTKLGNTKLAAVMAHTIMKGTGPKVVGIKGDDYLHLQSGLHIDEHEVVRVKKMCGMKLNVSISRKGGEFCGNSVSRAGMYPSITRAAMKAAASKARNYDQFCAQQQSYRDLIQEYQDCGLEETIHYSAEAEGVDPNYVETCLSFLNSMGHICKTQWEAVAKRRLNPRFHLPSAFGPQLI